MINHAIDESLRTKDLYYLGITQETIKDAREFIMSEDFIYIHKFAFGVKPQGLVPLLKRLWDRNDPEELERVRKAFQRENIAEERRDKSARITEKRGFVPNTWHGMIKRDSSGRFVND